MTPQNEARPPLPCGEGAGGEGRKAAALHAEKSAAQNLDAASVRPSSPTPPPQGRRGRAKLGHGWAPAYGEDRQKDHVRTKLRAARQRKEMTPSEKKLWKLLRSIEGFTFRRQPEIGDYVFDFACYSARGVWDRPAWVIAEVRARLDAPHPPTPSPQGRGGVDE